MYQAAGAVLAVLRRFRKTYPPMPERRSSEAATRPGSGIALDDGAIPFGFTEMKVRYLRQNLRENCRKTVTPTKRNGGFAARMGRLGELSLQWVSRGAIAQSRVEGKLGTGAIQA